MNKSDTLATPACQQPRMLRQVGYFAAVGFALLCMVFLVPDADPRQGAFFQAAMQTTWHNFLDFAAVWSSVKIILFSLALFLIIESAGATLAILKLRSLALSVFFLQALPSVCLLCGAYYLVKSLL